MLIWLVGVWAVAMLAVLVGIWRDVHRAAGPFRVDDWEDPWEWKRKVDHILAMAAEAERLKAYAAKHTPRKPGVAPLAPGMEDRP